MRTLVILMLIFWFNKPVYASDFKINFPVACGLGVNCWIMNYVDSDPNPRIAKDYACGSRTYEGHLGTDIAVRDLGAAEKGIFVVAASDGKVVEVRSNLVDKYYTPQSGTRSPCGNGITVVHEHGWESRYCHLKQNSITVERGETVKAGEILGQIGLSGMTHWPHLDFSLRRNGEVFDPFSGFTNLESCGHSPHSFFKRDLKYQPFSIFNLGFSVGPANEQAISQGQPKLVTLPINTPTLTFWAMTFGIDEGDVVEMSLIDPDGFVIKEDMIVAQQSSNKELLQLSHNIGSGLWKPGIYTGRIRLERSDGLKPQETGWERRIIFVD